MPVVNFECQNVNTGIPNVAYRLLLPEIRDVMRGDVIKEMW